MLLEKKRLDDVEPRVARRGSVATRAVAVLLCSMLAQGAWAAANLIHGASTTSYPTIQQAVNAAVDGDTIDVEAGTYTEQLTVTKAITLQGAGVGQTIIRSPASASLTVTGGNWKSLKNQDVIAIVGVKVGGAGSVTIRNLTVDGADQGYLPDGTYPSKMDYDFQGIGIYNTNALVENVLVTSVRELATDYGAVPPNFYPDEPSGMNHNTGIFAESAAGAGTHTVTVRNSTITKFQKNALLMWGPTLVVDVRDNLIQGYGQTMHSSGNGIQLASSDYTLYGGGDRRGSTGSLVNNRFLGFGHVVPPMAGSFDPATGSYSNGAYLNVGQSGPSGILLYQAGPGVLIDSNVVTGPGVPSWHSSVTSDDGGYASLGVNIYESPGVTVSYNIISGFDAGIFEGQAPAGSSISVIGNMLSNNTIDIWTAGGDDQISLRRGDEVVAFAETNNGVDSISGFGYGGRIYVVGFTAGSVNGLIGSSPVYMQDTSNAPRINGYLDGQPVVDFTSGGVTPGDGANVAPHSIQVLRLKGETLLYVDTDGVAGPAELQIRLLGEYRFEDIRMMGGMIYLGGALHQVPTLSEWARLLLVMVVLAFGLARVRGRI